MATPHKPTPGEFLRSAKAAKSDKSAKATKAAKSDKKEPGQAVSTKGKTAAEILEEKRRRALRDKEAAEGEVKRGQRAMSLEGEPTSVLEMEA